MDAREKHGIDESEKNSAKIRTLIV